MTRSAAGTRTAAGVRTAAPTQQNLWTQSAALTNAAWTKSNLTVTGGVIVGPDGITSDGAALIATSTSSVQHILFRLEPASVLIGQPACMSWYAKAGAVAFCALLFDGATDTPYFTLSGAGSAINGVGTGTASIVSVGGGWYRCAVTATRRQVASNAAIYSASAMSGGANSYAAADTSSAMIYVAWPQYGSVNYATPYAATTTTAVNTGAPRSLAGTRTAA